VHLLRKAAVLVRLVVARGRGVHGSWFIIRRNVRFFLSRGASLSLGWGVVIQEGCRFEISDAGVVQIGEHVFFNRNCQCTVVLSLDIGNGTMIGENVAIHDHDHPFGPEYGTDQPIRNRPLISSPVTIGENVWIGSGVIITRGVSIGDDAVVAAGAVVAKDVPARTLVGGVPARTLRSW